MQGSYLYNMLTPTERKELDENPIGRSVGDLKLRQNIGKKWDRFINEIDNTLPQDFKIIYDAYPRWGFYTTLDGKAIRRSYGVIKYAQENGGRYGLQMIDCTDNIDKVPIMDVILIYRWNEEQLAKINKSSNPMRFKDPLAWMDIIRSGV